MIEFLDAHPIVMIVGTAVIIGLLQIVAVKMQKVGKND